MWKMIFFLWLVPIVLAFIPLTRLAKGSQPIRAQERRLFFGKSGQSSFSAWGWVGLVVLAVGCFFIGVVQAVVFLNLSLFWIVTVPLLTGAAIVGLSVLLLRTQQSRRPRMRGQVRRPASFTHRIADLFSR